MPKKFSEQYIKKAQKSLEKIPVDNLAKIIETLYQAYKNNKQVFIMGNGGSASSASHFACDMGKGTAIPNKPRFRIISLNDNIPLFTALANDCRYESVFKEQLANLVNKDDVVIAITCSGNSPNTVKAIEYANSQKAVTVGLLGFDGGKLAKMVDVELTIPSPDKDYGLVESVHSTILHLIPEYLKQQIQNEQQAKQ